MEMRTMNALTTLLLLSAACSAYETPTHAHITKIGFDRSDLVVNSAELHGRLGFERLNRNQPFEVVPSYRCFELATHFDLSN